MEKLVWNNSIIVQQGAMYISIFPAPKIFSNSELALRNIKCKGTKT
jgi:hypothetical protein